tara:strand:+ start:194 stop:394 length:201 start_codon:yes stop_codon:yes gene_type:complete
MSDLFEDLDNLTRKIDAEAQGKKPEPKKASGSANKQKEFTYDLGDNELDAIITGRDGPRRANIYGD